MNTSFERSARFWLRAYPPRWRRQHADEVLGVLGDLAEPGATWVGLRAAWGLLLAGWAVRWRGRPPLGAWAGYRGLGLRVPREYRAWVADDIEGRWYALRQGNALVVAAAGALVAATNGSPVAVLPVWLASAVVVGVSQSRRGRQMAREKHLVAEPGEPLLPGTYVEMGVPRARLAARWAAPRLVVVLAACGLASGVGLVGAPRMLAPVPVSGLEYPANFELGAVPVGAARWVVLAVAVVAAVAGAVRAVRVRRVVGDRLARLPDQPCREVHTPGRWADVGLVALVVVMALDAWAEVTGRMPLLLSPVVVTVVALRLPGAAVLRSRGAALGWRSRGGAELAWVDQRWAVRHDAPPRPDGLERRVRRWDGPYVPGQVVLGPQRSEPPWPPVAT